MAGEYNSRTALIVEDSPAQASRVAQLLTQNGMTTIWARDAKEGLRHAQALLPDVIIMDVFMPGGMNGLQLCKYLKDNRKTRSIPIILLTQYDNKESAEFGLRLGAVEYIPKDAFSDAVLVRTLQLRGLI